MVTADASVDTRPVWLRTIGARYASLESHAFLLWGNRDDYVPGVGHLDPIEYLCTVMEPRFPTRVMYSPGYGITFPDQQSESAFQDWMTQHQVPLSVSDLPEIAPLSALPLLLRYLATTEKHSAVVIIDRLDLIMPPDKVTASTQDSVKAMLDAMPKSGRDRVLAANENILIMLSDTLESVHRDILTSAGIFKIEIPIPSKDQRREYIHTRVRWDSKGHHDEPTIKLAMSESALADSTAGLTLRNVEDVLLRGSKAGTVTWEVANSITAELIASEAAGLIKIVTPEGGFERIGGMNHFKQFAREWIIEAAASDDPARRAAMPMVIEFMGPPGTAKTETAYALGYEMEGWNVIEYESTKDSLVGATEHNEMRAEKIIRNRLPAVLVFDEADQMFGRVTGGTGGGGESVDKAVFRNRLRLLNDTSLQGRLIILVLTNRPDVLDGAISDRCDYRIPFLPAETPEARADILSRLLARKGITATVNELLPAARKLDDNWSGRDMKGLVTKAFGLMQLRDCNIIDGMNMAVDSRRPTQRSDAKLMTQLAIDEANDLDLVPEKYRNKPVDRASLDREIAATRSRADGGSRDF